MPMKLRKLHETATLEAGATMPRAFSYKTAFFVFIACLVCLGGLVYLVFYLVTMNMVTTTYAEAVPSVEMDIIAQGEGKIVAMNVAYGDAVKEGQVLFTVEPREDSADKARLDALQAAADFEQKKLELLKGGADFGTAVLNDVQRRHDDARAVYELAQADVMAEAANMTSVDKTADIFLRGKERELKEAELVRDRAEAYFKIAKENLDKAKEYYTGENRLITLDKYMAAENEFKVRELEYEFAKKQMALYEQAIEDAKSEGQARRDAQKEQQAKAEHICNVRKKTFEAVEKDYNDYLKFRDSAAPGEDARDGNAGRRELMGMQEARLEQAKLEVEKFRREKGFVTYRSPFSGKVGWIQRKQYDTVGPDDFVMKLFKTDSMEIQARLGQDVAGRLSKGQEVDVKVRTETGSTHIKGRVEAITNQFYTLRPNVRERVRIENPTAEMNLIVVRISLEGEDKKILFPGDPVTVTIYTSK